MSSYLILCRDDYGGVSEVPIVYKSGELSEVGEWIAAALEPGTFWQNVASDRSGVIIENRMRIAALGSAIEKLKAENEELNELVDYARGKLGPLLESAARA